MKIRPVLAVGVVLAVACGLAPSLSAQNKEQKRTKQEQQDIEALVKLVDAVASGQQPAPADVPVKWEGNHFLKSADGSTYIPFTLSIDRSKLNTPNAAMYIRVVSKEAAPAPTASKGEEKDRVLYPWADIHFIEVKPDGKLARGIALKPGDYEVFVAVKDRTTEQRNQPPAKMGLLRHPLTVPDFNKPELTSSSVILASSIEPLPAPLSPEQQQDNPYTFGILKVVPNPDTKFTKAGELQFVFWVYGASQDANHKPDISIEYNFHQKTPEGEKYFNKTAPQMLNAQTLPPQFDLAAGHQLLGNLSVPLASFPAGDYRIEIKITDKPSGKTLTQNVAFSVGA